MEGTNEYDMVFVSKLMGLVCSSEEASKCLNNRKVIPVVQNQAILFTSADAQTVD